MSALDTPLDTAILLAAGAGSRLRMAAPSKPLCRVGGTALIDHALTRMAAAGIARAIVVVGYEREAIEAHLAAHDWPLAVETVPVADWRLPNGVSALAGATLAQGPALLAMCDHIVDPALYRQLAEAGPGEGLRLGVDRRLSSPVVDLDDVTRVATRGGRIVGIGKGIAAYDAFDTGVFAVGPAFFAALADLEAPSITEGVRLLAAQGIALVEETGTLDWIDVDDPTALAQAEAWLATGTMPGSEAATAPLRLRAGGETRMTIR